MAKRNNRILPRKKRPAGPRTPGKYRSAYVQLNVLPGQQWFPVRRGTTVWEALQKHDIKIPGDCGGIGKCGKCRVRVVSAIGRPTKEEVDLIPEDELNRGIRLACRTEIRKDMQIDVGAYDPSAEHNQILKTGWGPILQLEPLVDLRVLSPVVGVPNDGTADFDRVKHVLGPEYQDVKPSLHALRSLPSMVQDEDLDVAGVIHENTLLGWRRHGAFGKQFGIAFDIGTTTLVGKLISLFDAHEIAVVSRLNSQSRFGSDVVSRLQFVQDRSDGLDWLNATLIEDLNRIIRDLLQTHDLVPEDIFVAVAAGNTTMQHLLLKLPPLGIARSPFRPVVTDGMAVKAEEVGLALHPEALLYVMPVRSGYIGGDTIGVVLASGVAEQEHEIILGLDLGTNGEIFLGNARRLMTCSAAAGPALEGARIEHGMIAKTGAVEGVRIDDGMLFYRVIGNTKPRGLCGSGLVDLVAVLLHCGVINHEGLIQPTDLNIVENINDRLIPHDDVYDFLIAGPEESYTGRPVVLTQRDVRELQLAKGAVAAGVQTLLDEMALTHGEIDRLHLAGALGNYVNPTSAMRIGLFPQLELDRIVPLGNGALTGSSMALLSRSEWREASTVARFIEHVELSSRLDFNGYFVSNLDFPQDNIW